MSKYKDLMKSYIYIYIRSKRFLYFDIYLNTAYTTHYAYLQYMNGWTWRFKVAQYNKPQEEMWPMQLDWSKKSDETHSIFGML